MLLLSEALNIMDNLDDLCEALKVAPKLYDDGLKPGVKATGKVLALIPEAINAALAPLQQWIDKREYNVAETKKLLQLKLDKVGVEHIDMPEPYVAVPALQAISYTMSSDVLRNLYANLLARSMTDSEKNKVHPSFVEIIKQLSPDEARLISCLIDIDSVPLIEIRRVINNEGSFFIELCNFTCLADNICDRHDPVDIAGYIDNLCRLRIIEIPEGRYLVGEDTYKPLEEHPIIVDIMNTPLPKGQRWKIVKKKLEVTSFGKEFIEVCVKDI